MEVERMSGALYHSIWTEEAKGRSGAITQALMAEHASLPAMGGMSHLFPLSLGQ